MPVVHPFDLSDRRALVTGAGGGLGFAIAKGLARAGAQVVLNGRNRDKLDMPPGKFTINPYSRPRMDSESAPSQFRRFFSTKHLHNILIVDRN